KRSAISDSIASRTCASSSTSATRRMSRCRGAGRTHMANPLRPLTITPAAAPDDHRLGHPVTGYVLDLGELLGRVGRGVRVNLIGNVAFPQNRFELHGEWLLSRMR